MSEMGELIEYDKFTHKGDIFICSKKDGLHIPIFIMPILSSYTTSLGRLKLWDSMNKHDESIIYADTDSIFSLKQHWSDSDELGELKLEYAAEKGIFIKPKFYRIPDKDTIKIKGLGKRPDGDLFDSILRGDAVQYDKFSRYKESLTRNIPFSSIIDTEKKFTLEDTKRSWHHRFSPFKMEISEPLTLIDGISESDRTALYEK
jgi:hypothetical protein